MDGDRALAARKLPQTSANFFVGTNSRVPRMTLAQSSHIIPIPTVKSPNPKPSSNVVLKRLQGSPFLTSPTSARSATFPRSAFNEGGKAAKAAQFFSALADASASTAADQTQSPQGPSRLVRSSTSTETGDRNTNTKLNKARRASDAVATDVDELATRTSGKRRPEARSASEPSSSLPEASISGPVASNSLDRSRSTPPLGNPSSGAEDKAEAHDLEQPQPRIEVEVSALASPGVQSSPNAPDPQSSQDNGYFPAVGLVDTPTRAPTSAFSDATSLTHSPLSGGLRTGRIVSSYNGHETPTRPERSRLAHEPLSLSLQEGKRCHLEQATELSLLDSRSSSSASARPGLHPSGDKGTDQGSSASMSKRYGQQEEPVTYAIREPQGGGGSSVADGTFVDERETGQNHDDQRRASSGSANHAFDEPPSIQPTQAIKITEHSTEANDRDDVQSLRTGDQSSEATESRKRGGNSRGVVPMSPASSGPHHWTTSPAMQSVTDEDVLLDLIESNVMPVPTPDDVKDADSPFERTASWIQSTIAVGEALATEPLDEDHDAIDELSMAYGVPSKSLDGTSSVTASAQPLFHDRTRDARQQTRQSPIRTVKTSTRNLVTEKARAIEAGTVDSPTASSTPSTKLRSMKITKSYSQRARSNSKLGRPVKPVPGRLKIPGRSSESAERQRRRSLDLLLKRRAQVGSVPHSNTPPSAGKVSRQHAATERASNFNGILGLWSHQDDTQTSQPVFVDAGNQRVGQMVQEWDDIAGSDDEVASVTVGRRMVLRRLSDLAAQSEVGVSSRPLPGKLTRGKFELDQEQETHELLRPLRQSGPVQADLAPVAVKILNRPPARIAHPPVQPVEAQEPRPLPGKLVRAHPNSTPADNGQGLVRPLRKLRPDEVIESAREIARPLLHRGQQSALPAPDRLARPTPGKLHRPQHEHAEEVQEVVRPLRRLRPDQGGYSAAQISKTSLRPGKRSEQIVAINDDDESDIECDSTAPADQRPSDLPSRSMVLEDQIASIKGASEIENANAQGPQEILPSPKSTQSDVEEPQEHDPLASSTVSPQQPSPSARTAPLKPLRLQTSQSPLQTTASPLTAPQPGVSTTSTSPNTVLSEVWTPDPSNPSRSALTDETRVNTPTGSRAHFTAIGMTAGGRALDETRMDRRMPVGMRVIGEARTNGDSLASPTTIRGQPRSSDPARRGRESHVSLMRSTSGETPASRSRTGTGTESQPRYQSTGPSLREHTSLKDVGDSTAPAQSTATPPPGFEIKFQLSEPKMAPHTPSATLMEFAFRVVIHPIGGEPAESSYRLVPTSRSQPRPSERYVDPGQFEHSHLPPTEMVAIQAQAQAHLLHTIQSSEQRTRTKHHHPHRRPFQEEATPSQPYREMLLPKSRQNSISRSTSDLSLAPSSPARKGRASSTGMASPLPYIKRALPRVGARK